MGNGFGFPFGAAGSGHSGGFAPDPGGTAHTPPYLLGEDSAYHAVASGAWVALDSVQITSVHPTAITLTEPSSGYWSRNFAALVLVGGFAAGWSGSITPADLLLQVNGITSADYSWFTTSHVAGAADAQVHSSADVAVDIGSMTPANTGTPELSEDTLFRIWIATSANGLMPFCPYVESVVVGQTTAGVLYRQDTAGRLPLGTDPINSLTLSLASPAINIAHGGVTLYGVAIAG